MPSMKSRPSSINTQLHSQNGQKALINGAPLTVTTASTAGTETSSEWAHAMLDRALMLGRQQEIDNSLAQLEYKIHQLETSHLSHEHAEFGQARIVRGYDFLTVAPAAISDQEKATSNSSNNNTKSEVSRYEKKSVPERDRIFTRSSVSSKWALETAPHLSPPVNNTSATNSKAPSQVNSPSQLQATDDQKKRKKKRRKSGYY